MGKNNKEENKKKHQKNLLTEKSVIEALSDVYDPEMHIDIVSLGLIYKIKITDDNDLNVTMTLTFPGCPYGPAIIEEVEDALSSISGARNVKVEITFNPPWSPDKIDPDIKAAMGL